MSIIKIVIKGCSGYGPVDMAYDDKLTLTQTSISYEYKPYMESETNPSRKWSHRTNSPLFKVGFERVVATMPSVLEPKEIWECTDVGMMDFTVMVYMGYKDLNHFRATYLNPFLNAALQFEIWCRLQK